MEAPPPWLPLDLIVQIFARSDLVTIARGPATCKAVRRRIASPDFRGRLLRSTDRFLLGMFSLRADLWEEQAVRVYPLISPANEHPPIPVASFMSRNTDLFDTHRLVASRDGLLVLMTRRGKHEEVCVCDPVTGNRTSFPLPEKVTGHVFVVLPLDDNNDGRAADLSSFKLLVADKNLNTQTFSSTEGSWGPVTRTPDLPIRRHSTMLVQRFPVVVGGVAYWLHKLSGKREFHVVALDVRTGLGRSFEVPQYCLRRLLGCFAYKDLLARSPDGAKLILVVAEDNTFSAWTVPQDAEESWTRSVLIQRTTILRSVTPLLSPLACQGVAFEWFGERSNSMVFQMHGVGLLVLNLRTKQIHQLESYTNIEYNFDPLCPYELDLESLFYSQ